MKDTLPESHDRPLFRSLARRRRSAGPPAGILAGLVFALAAPGGGWYWLRSREAPAAADEIVGRRAVDAPEAASAPRPLSVPPLDLPALEASDAFVREVVGRLSAHPRLAAWIVPDELVHRFVVAVVRLAGGYSPARELTAVAPDGEFGVQEREARLFVDASSHRRYDALVEAFVSLDTEGTVVLFHQLRPLFEEAYGELGLRARTFDEVLARAVANLLVVEVPDGPLEVVPHESVYRFADPALEARGEAGKHLLRMGPDNARRFQAKLRELAEGIGVATGP